MWVCVFDGNLDLLNYQTDTLKIETLITLFIRYWWQFPWLLIIRSRTFVLSDKTPNLRIDSAASSGSRVNLVYFMFFTWPPLEAALSISTFCYLHTHCLRSVHLRKKMPSMKHYQVPLRLKCCNICWLNILCPYVRSNRTGTTGLVKSWVESVLK